MLMIGTSPKDFPFRSNNYSVKRRSPVIAQVVVLGDKLQSMSAYIVLRSWVFWPCGLGLLAGVRWQFVKI